VVGDLQGGCFGYGGPPDSVTVTIQALQGTSVKASTTVTETRSDTTGGPFRMLGGQYRLTVPAGKYTIVASGPNFTLNGKPWVQGAVSVAARRTTAVPTVPMSACG
jgi:hypothetical protein